MSEIEEAIKIERERCAKIAEHYKPGMLEMRGLLSEDQKTVEEAEFRMYCVNKTSALIARDIRAGITFPN